MEHIGLPCFNNDATALDFYPICPASNPYVLVAPLFKKVMLQLENGKQVVIKAVAISAENRKVSGLK
ncbi:glycoside hydrolase domain-containing protein [Larkinella insperata]|uniref:Glycoside hydrolase domain-containing protein n=1 Tax=Larkinella insperata TaxID=332158 RepID=A0ABW3QLR1_9BACT